MDTIFESRKVRVISVIILTVFLSGCASLREAGKKAWGSSTQALEKAKDKGKLKSFQCTFSDCFDACLEVLKEKKAVIFEKDKKSGYIVAMNFEGAIDTTEVGIFFEKGEKGITKIKITSLNPRLLEVISPYIFSNIAKQIKLKYTNQNRKER